VRLEQRVEGPAVSGEKRREEQLIAVGSRWFQVASALPCTPKTRTGTRM